MNKYDGIKHSIRHSSPEVVLQQMESVYTSMHRLRAVSFLNSVLHFTMEYDKHGLFSMMLRSLMKYHPFVDEEYALPLFYACMYDAPLCLEYLLSLDSVVSVIDATDFHGNTPIAVAAMYQPHFIYRLVDSGSSMTFLNIETNANILHLISGCDSKTDNCPPKNFKSLVDLAISQGVSANQLLITPEYTRAKSFNWLRTPLTVLCNQIDTRHSDVDRRSSTDTFTTWANHLLECIDYLCKFSDQSSLDTSLMVSVLQFQNVIVKRTSPLFQKRLISVVCDLVKIMICNNAKIYAGRSTYAWPKIIDLIMIALKTAHERHILMPTRLPDTIYSEILKDMLNIYNHIALNGGQHCSTFDLNYLAHLLMEDFGKYSPFLYTYLATLDLNLYRSTLHDILYTVRLKSKVVELKQDDLLAVLECDLQHVPQLKCFAKMMVIKSIGGRQNLNNALKLPLPSSIITYIFT